MAKIIAIVGATGRQGGSLIAPFLRDNTWHIRALTRDPSSSKAKELAAKGVEVVKADVNNRDEVTISLVLRNFCEEL
jgi:uncharacterized protein YbjT (DUF2867 family)